MSLPQPDNREKEIITVNKAVTKILLMILFDLLVSINQLYTV